jgi:hypothetical protein
VGPVDDQPGERAEEPDLPDTLFADQLDDADGEADAAPDDGEPAAAEFEDGFDDLEADEPRRNALPRRLESWRTRSATGAVISAMAMGLQQVFAPQREKPAIIAEAPSDPYDDDDPIVVEYVADDASGTTVILRPWLMPGAEGAAKPEVEAPAEARDEDGE